jgi:hypothetical protein
MTNINLVRQIDFENPNIALFKTQTLILNVITT